MENLLPAFRPPPATKSVPATSIVQKHVAKYPSVVAELRKKEAEAKLAYLKDRPVEKEVYLNGWPLDAPHLRHTVLFGGVYPDRSEDRTLNVAGDSSLPLLMDGMVASHKLVDDPARSAYSEVRSLAVSLKQTDLSVAASGLLDSQATFSTVRIPLPHERAAAARTKRSIKSTALPDVVLPVVPLRKPEEGLTITSAIRSHTGTYRTRPPPADTVVLSPTTFAICNCFESAPAESFSSIARKMRHTALPPNSMTIFHTPAFSGKTSDVQKGALDLPDVCRVVFEDRISRRFRSKGVGQFVHVDPAEDGDVEEWERGELPEFSDETGVVPPSAGQGMYVAFVPGSTSVTLRLPPSLIDETPITFAFVNTHRRHAMEVYWVDYEGQLVVRKVLGPGERYHELTYATHPWVLRDRATEESLLVCCGPGAANVPVFSAILWRSEPRAKSVSVSFESASAKRLTGSPATAKLIDPTNTSMTSSLDGSSTVTAGSVLALESMSQPGELEQLVLTAELDQPKFVVTLTDEAPENPLDGEFLRRAFAIKAKKSSGAPRKK